MRYIVLALLALMSQSADARAWGDEGHKIVCEIAFRLAQPDTRAAVRKLIRADTEFDTFSDSCVFPDHPRKRASEHFINLARTSQGLTSDDCPQAEKCVLSAILNDSKILASKSAKKADRLLALKFLGHWVGDIHQPLHVSFEDDRGGNNITVTGLCSGKLHSTWDTCLVEKAVGTDVADAVDELIDEITPEMITKWSASDSREWANESFAITQGVKTGYCVMHGSSCDLPNSAHVTIDAAYIDSNTPVVKEQLQKAGVRLFSASRYGLRKLTGEAHMAIKHTFKATSAIMSVGGFRFSGKFVLNGNVNADGSLEIVPSNNPGEDKAFYTGDLTRPEIKIQSNSVGFDGLSQRLRAAHTVEITFTSNSDLGVSPSLTGVSIFSFSIRRNFT